MSRSIVGLVELEFRQGEIPMVWRGIPVAAPSMVLRGVPTDYLSFVERSKSIHVTSLDMILGVIRC